MPRITDDEGRDINVTPLIKRYGLLFGASALIAYGVFTSYYTVGAGERAIVLTWGAVSDVTGPGLHFKIPYIQTIRRVNVQTNSFEWSATRPMESYSKDQQPAKLSVKVTYHIMSDVDSITKLYSQYRDEDNFKQSVLFPRTYEGVKTVFGQFNAVAAIQERARLNSEVEASVRKLANGPVVIEGVQIQDITFSDDYENAVEERMKAQVEVDRIAMNLERERKQAEIKIVQAHAEQERLVSIGRGQAEAINLRGKALRDNPELVALTAAEKWDGKLPTTMVPGSAVPFINVK